MFRVPLDPNPLDVRSNFASIAQLLLCFFKNNINGTR